MKKRISILLLTTVCLGISLFLISCSDDDIIAPYTETTTDASLITYYFPIDQGYTATYEVRDSDGRPSATTFKVGGAVPFSNSTATHWFYQKGTGYDTSFIVVTGASLYLYEGINGTGERILQGPLQPGAKWTRYPGYDSDTASIVTGDEDFGEILGGEDGGNGGAVTKVFPTTGSNELKVEAVETIILANGSSFAGAARVVNQLSDGSTNKYWFAPGYGLVRYVIGATQSYPNGRQLGELVSFVK